MECDQCSKKISEFAVVTGHQDAPHIIHPHVRVYFTSGFKNYLKIAGPDWSSILVTDILYLCFLLMVQPLFQRDFLFPLPFPSDISLVPTNPAYESKNLVQEFTPNPSLRIGHTLYRSILLKKKNKNKKKSQNIKSFFTSIRNHFLLPSVQAPLRNRSFTISNSFGLSIFLFM